jgi:2,3-bisphosphoglycerate-independent phosphoglycerate mutase
MPLKPTALIILDGWGYSEKTDKNAIAHAATPNMDKLWSEDCHGLISGSGMDVGLPEGQMGNSEVGHLNLGAGRVVYQEFTRISKAIETGEFMQNPVLLAAIDKVLATDSTLHIMGLLSDGGVHSHESHIHAMIKMAIAKGVNKIALHAFLDGRDTPPRSAETSLHKADALFQVLGKGKVASICGRYFAMDRDNRWERVQKAYDMLTLGSAQHHAPSAVEGLKAAYSRNENDEFVQPTIIGEATPIADNDAVIFMNFRADRAREITRSFVDQDFSGFTKQASPKLSDFVMLTSYSDDIKAPIAFAPLRLDNVLGQYISDLGFSQLRIAETEKYAHVTFFFSGGVEQPYPGEERVLVPSPDVATYDLQPEMNAPLLCEKLCDSIKAQAHDLIVCNFANPDMVGHTGNFEAAVKAIEAVDQAVGNIIEALDQVGGQCIITADHGNAEQMVDHHTEQAHTAHTSGPVPFIYHGRDAKMAHDDGVLSDIAPTLLHLMDIEIPKEMTGRVLVELS